MRALVIAVALVVWCGVATAGPRAGFDHARHDEVACTKCHAVRAGELVGKPGHAACFGACHGPAPVAQTGKPPVFAATQRAVCIACHADDKLAAPVPANRRGFAVDYPPFRVAPDFAVGLGHAKHAASACTDCHAAPDAAPRGAPHRRCASCHDGKAKTFAITECRNCHSREAGAAMRPAELLVDTAFVHAKHAARGGAGKQCATCHAGIDRTDERALPRPTMASCATVGCHDNKAAFGVTATCTKCHRDPPAAIFAVARPSTRFSHTLSAHAAANLPCATCHTVAKSGEIEVAGHAPCAACHADDFAARQPKICGACHNGTEPWRPLVADRFPAERTELGATLPHDQHTKVACTSCHSLTTATAQLRPARGHSACTTSGCHAKSGGPSPQIVQCEKCHELGLAERRDAARRATRWSVRARFDHAPHEQQGTGDAAKPLPCTTCHVDMTAKHVLDLAAPTKSTCAPCHDGGTAFKLTGTTCTRCHPGPTTRPR